MGFNENIIPEHRRFFFIDLLAFATLHAAFDRMKGHASIEVIHSGFAMFSVSEFLKSSFGDGLV